MIMTVGRVLWIVAVVLLCASCAFLALSFATGGTVREVTGKMYLAAYFAFMALLPICILALVIERIHAWWTRPATAPGSPAPARQDGAPAHRP